MRAALSLLMYFACMAVGTLLVANQFRPTLMPTIVSGLHTDTGRLAASGISVVLLLGPLAIWLRWLQVMRRSREISYQTENGRISVSLLAIEEALTRALEGEPEVKKAHVRVLEDRIKRTVIIEAVMTLWEVPNVTDRNRFCQRLLRRRFAELMPEQTAVQVNLTVHRLTMRRPESYAPPVPTTTSVAREHGKPSTASLDKRDRRDGRDGEGESTYRDPLMDSGVLPVQGGDEDLYVGPSYPVAREEEDEAAQLYTSPTPDKKPTGPAKKSI